MWLTKVIPIWSSCDRFFGTRVVCWDSAWMPHLKRTRELIGFTFIAPAVSYKMPPLPFSCRFIRRLQTALHHSVLNDDPAYSTSTLHLNSPSRIATSVPFHNKHFVFSNYSDLRNLLVLHCCCCYSRSLSRGSAVVVQCWFYSCHFGLRRLALAEI